MTLRATYRRLALLLVIGVAASLTVIGLAAATTWTHSVTGGYDVWYLNGTQEKFRYNLTNQQWSDFSTIGSTWYTISETGRSSTFIGDGHWRDLGNGFSYQYSAGYNRGSFKDGAAQRFMYNYASGQWYDSADTLSWQTLGKAGLNAGFVGDGAWYDLGNGFTYQYSAGYDKGTFKDGAAQRFQYNYASGQWYDSADTLSWQTLGASGLNAGFLGDGHWRALGNGFTYQYSAGYDKGTFKDGAAQRFLYKYPSGQWYDSADTLSWQALGKAGRTAVFVGDGVWYDLGNGFTYQYSAASDTGTFRDSAAQRFMYNYASGQWYDRADTVSWQTLGNSGLNAGFLGDGHWRDLGNGFTYQYSAGYDKGTFKDGAAQRFLYKYGPGQWYNSGDTLSWQALGANGLNAAFVGSGEWVDLGNGFTYQYSAADDKGTFKYGAAQRFQYNYASGQWWNEGPPDTGWQKLGPTQLSAAFLGDGHWHMLDSIWSYKLVGGIGYLDGSVYEPNYDGYGGWDWSTAQFTCNYASQIFGLYDSGVTSSVFRYDDNGGSLYSCKWQDWNYNISSKWEVSAAIVFYTGNSTHNVSSWLSWLPVQPNPGFITRTETWDFTNNDWANRYNHEVRAFATTWDGLCSWWDVQREQGDYANCGIIASIDCFEAKTGLYAGYTQTWLETAIAHGWACGSPSDPTNYGRSMADGNFLLINFMAYQLNAPVTMYSGRNQDLNLYNLLSSVSAGQKVLIDIDLACVPAFETTGLHAIVLVGLTTINGQSYAEITNGWDIQSNTTQISGTDPKQAYPITYIPLNELNAAYLNVDQSLHTWTVIE